MRSVTLSETDRWKGSRTEKNGSPGKIKIIMKRCSKKKSLKYVVCKKEDFARDDNNKLSVDNQKLLIFQKQTFKELSSSLHIVRYSKGQLSNHSLLAKL